LVEKGERLIAGALQTSRAAGDELLDQTVRNRVRMKRAAGGERVQEQVAGNALRLNGVARMAGDPADLVGDLKLRPEGAPPGRAVLGGDGGHKVTGAGQVGAVLQRQGEQLLQGQVFADERVGGHGFYGGHKRDSGIEVQGQGEADRGFVERLEGGDQVLSSFGQPGLGSKLVCRDAQA